MLIKITRIYDFILFAIFFLFAVLVAFCYVYLSVHGTSNPDIDSYEILLNSCSLQSPCTVEPLFWIYSDFARIIHVVFFVDVLPSLYFLYQTTIVFLLALTARIICQRFSFDFYLLLLLMIGFSLTTSLIQIRFGLSLSLVICGYALLNNMKYSFCGRFLMALGCFSHYSVIPFFMFSLMSCFLMISSISRFAIALSSFSLFVYLLGSPEFVSLLPNIFSSRIGTYFYADLPSVSASSRVVATMIAFMLSLSIAMNIKKYNINIASLGVISFIPYVITPHMEILIRVAVPFQYILLIHLIYTWKKKEWFFLSTAPLLAFFGYRVVSNFYYVFGLMK